jgi:hypothetical protein
VVPWFIPRFKWPLDFALSRKLWWWTATPPPYDLHNGWLVGHLGTTGGAAVAHLVIGMSCQRFGFLSKRRGVRQKICGSRVSKAQACIFGGAVHRGGCSFCQSVAAEAWNLSASVHGLRRYDAPNAMIYKGFMLSGVPNFAFVFGYVNASWTIKAGDSCRLSTSHCLRTAASQYSTCKTTQKSYCNWLCVVHQIVGAWGMVLDQV